MQSNGLVHALLDVILAVCVCALCVCGDLSVLSPTLIVFVSRSLIPSLSFHTVPVSVSVSVEAFVVTL